MDTKYEDAIECLTNQESWFFDHLKKLLKFALVLFVGIWSLLTMNLVHALASGVNAAAAKEQMIINTIIICIGMAILSFGFWRVYQLQDKKLVVMRKDSEGQKLLEEGDRLLSLLLLLKAARLNVQTGLGNLNWVSGELGHGTPAYIESTYNDIKKHCDEFAELVHHEAVKLRQRQDEFLAKHQKP